MNRLTEIKDGWVHLIDDAGAMDITELREYCNKECLEKCGGITDIKPKNDDDEPYCENCNCVVNWFYQSFVGLAEYEEKQEQGLLVELPCKVGDKLFFLDREDNILSLTAEKIAIIDSDGDVNLFEWFGKTVFTTREQAEKALEGMK